jgi:hypothetical protein
MAMSFAWAFLGALFWLVADFLCGAAGGAAEYSTLQRAVCAVLGGGLGGIAGAVVGAAGAIEAAIHWSRPSS